MLVEVAARKSKVSKFFTASRRELTLTPSTTSLKPLTIYGKPLIFMAYLSWPEKVILDLSLQNTKKETELPTGSQTEDFQMGAQLDRSQKTAFYFGNADKDLAHLMPVADEIHVTKNTAGDLLEILTRAENSLNELIAKRKNLSFLIADLKRSIS